MEKCARWTQEEIDYLKKNYGKIKCSEMLKYLKNRTWVAIVSKGYNLKLKSNRTFLIQGEKNPFWHKKHTKQMKNRCSKLAKKRFEKIENRFIGKKNGMFGKHHSPETREKMKKWYKNPKNKKKIEEFCKRHAKTISGENNVSKREDVRKKLREKLSGKNNPAYKDGKSREPYHQKFNKYFKEQIRQRDNKCMICKWSRNKCKKYYNWDLIVHHIDRNKKSINPNNLICLCLSHHSKITNIQNDLQDYFYAKNLGFL